jgi:predicted RNase H-like HicB family nuclease
MKNNIAYYLKLDYPITLKRLDDGKYCAEITIIRGCKGYGDTIHEALEELNDVKKTLIELLLEQGKSIPEPTIQLEIPQSQFQRLSNKKKLLSYAK